MNDPGFPTTIEAMTPAWLTQVLHEDGVLGQGSHLHVHLTPGTHHLTLTATDADGLHATASVTVTVQYRRLYLPLVRR